jgi:putative ABC transport system permease protein
MLITETLTMALSQVRAHKFRSFLTVLGIVVGVGCVIVVASLLTGMRGQIVSVIEEYGTNNIYAFHLSTGINFGEPDRKERLRPPLTFADGQMILRDAPAVEDVASQLFVGFIDTTIVYESASYRRGQLQGVTTNYAQLTNLQIQEGRFISSVDDYFKRDVLVIGQNVAEALFPSSLMSSARASRWRARRSRS